MSFMTTEKPLSTPSDILAEYTEFWEEIGFDSFEDIVESAENDTVDDFWETFGELRCGSFSPRPGEYAYFRIDHAAENFTLALVVPFDQSGQLSHCARLTLETRSRELQSHEFSWELSKVMLQEVREDVEDFLAAPTATELETAPSLCEIDHRFLYPADETSVPELPLK